LFSNTLAPAIAYTSLTVLDILGESHELRDRLMDNTRYLRQQMRDRGFDINDGIHPITPIMLYDAKLAQQMARDLLDEGIYVIGFSYPVVPQGLARIRVQVSAAHTRSHLDHCVDAFTRVGKTYNVIKTS
jgi:glycine C-acetyltransferase